MKDKNTLWNKERNIGKTMKPVRENKSKQKEKPFRNPNFMLSKNLNSWSS